MITKIPPKFETIQDVKEAMTVIEVLLQQTKDSVKQNRESFCSYMLYCASSCNSAINLPTIEEKNKKLKELAESFWDTAKEVAKEVQDDAPQQGGTTGKASGS